MSTADARVQRLDGKLLLKDLLDVDALVDAPGWLPFRVGVEVLHLYGEEADGPSAALLRYSPGASVPPHQHLGYEHVVVLSGSQRDAQGTYGRGALVISEPGSRHAVVSDEGCVVLVLWNRPVAFESATNELELEEGVTP